MRRIPLFLSVTFALIIMAPATHAQEASKISITRLQSLYGQQLKAPDDTYIQRLITDERAKIRTQVEGELKALIAPTLAANEQTDSQALTGAVDRQRSVLSVLGDRLNEFKADADLLSAEENRFYGKNAVTPTDEQKIRLTETHQELLAKKAMLEEGIASATALIELQDSRLRQLVNQQRLEQFGSLIGIGKYVLIIALVLFFERMIRIQFIAKITDDNRRYRITKTFGALVYGIAILWLLSVVYSKNPNMLASVAIIGAGVAIALQDIVKDIVGWFVIVQNQLFSRGHRITIGQITGEITDYGLLRTSMLEIGTPRIGEPQQVLERTGKLLSLPNAIFLTQAITNHSTTSGYVRAEMRFTITFESDWRKAKEIIESILEEDTAAFSFEDNRQIRIQTHRYFIPHRTSGNQVYVDIATDGIELTLRFTVPIGERRPVVSGMSQKILDAFEKEPSIAIAYTTYRIIPTQPS